MPKKTLQIFCARCQAETSHVGEVDLNGELVFTCDCGAFLKLPAPKASGMDSDAIKVYFEEHKVSNEGQVSVQDSQDVLNELADSETKTVEE